MGGAIAAVSLVGLWKSRSFIEQTSKGRLLVHLFGPTGGVVVLQSVLVLTTLLGLLLLANVIRPMQW
jgi:hypothetical protein